MMRGILRLLPPTLLVAALVHLATVWAAPKLVMHLVMDGAASHAGLNHPQHAPKTSAATRFVPLPSPDLLYSTCVIDVSHGAVDVSVTPGDTYLSLSVFDSDTNNVFVASDRTSGGKPIRLRILPPQGDAPVPDGVMGVHVPGTRALLLLRALASTPELAAKSEAARQTLSCAPAV